MAYMAWPTWLEGKGTFKHGLGLRETLTFKHGLHGLRESWGNLDI